MTDNNRFKLSIANYTIEFVSQNKLLLLTTSIGIKNFVVDNNPSPTDLLINVKGIDNLSFDDWNIVFAGKQFDFGDGAYSWDILVKDTYVCYRIDFLQDACINHVYLVFDKSSNIGTLYVDPKTEFKQFVFDPVLHPVGSLLYYYLLNSKGHFMIHASGVLMDDCGYLFTGVSGIGKSTMANLWKSCGAIVINDDRLVVKCIGDEVEVWNTPMNYYSDVNKCGSLKAIFLLSQSDENSVSKIDGVKAVSLVLANTIQQNYNREKVLSHLGRVVELCKRIPVYSLGFKPDTDIVKLIQEMSL